MKLNVLHFFSLMMVVLASYVQAQEPAACEQQLNSEIGSLAKSQFEKRSQEEVGLKEVEQAAANYYLLWTKNAECDSLLLKYLEGSFFHAANISNDSKKVISEFDTLLSNSKSKVNALKDLPKLDATQSEILYYYASALGFRSELIGVYEAFSNWSTIKKMLQKIISNGDATVNYYGAYRTLAIANTKIPAPFGDLNTAKTYALKIFNSTKAPILETSIFSMNTVIYATVLRRTDDDATSCAVLKTLTKLNAEELASLNKDLIIENSIQQKSASLLLAEWKCP
jgi:hypothetical protein